MKKLILSLLFLTLVLLVHVFVLFLENAAYAQVFTNVEFVDNYDADSITVNLNCDIEYFCRSAKIRLMGIDTPELRTKDDCERYAAVQAKNMTNYLLRHADQINLTDCKPGKYHREVCNVYYDGMNLTDVLIENNFGYKYHGGKKQNIDWCKYYN